ncbi:putative transcription factor [Rosellinia necatrix]|uniref:Putative transcription factor n=1 Tax=Rosellinia necatrix TaxID=77044 RepID=A0A1S7UIU6_ROSNE|nr:putative transcription factor [Rosellinia necatrix]
MDDKGMSYINQPTQDRLFASVDRGWAASSTGIENTMAGNPPLATNFPMLTTADGGMLSQQDPMSAPPELYAHSMPWGPPTDMASAPFSEMPGAATHIQGPHARSQSFDDTGLSAPLFWGDSKPYEVMSYPQVQTPNSIASNYFPSPTTPNVQATLSYSQNGGSCPYFPVCVQALTSLHNAPIQPPASFEHIQNITTKAMDGCLLTLSCPSCFVGHRGFTITMLIATIMLKLSSLYRSAALLYPEVGSAMPILEGSSGSSSNAITLGGYHVGPELSTWLKIEMLAREVHKLGGAFDSLRINCTSLLEEQEFTKILIDCIGRDIDSTEQAVRQRRTPPGAHFDNACGI